MYDKMEEAEKLTDSHGQSSIAITQTVDKTAGIEGKSKDITVQVENPPAMVDPAVIEKLTMEVLGLFLPNLQKAKSSLNEIQHNQDVLIETLLLENGKLNEMQAKSKLIETMQQAKQYHTKLVNLKKEMNMLTEKTTKLKERALKLSQQKEKKDRDRASQLEKELERESRLTAKPVISAKSDVPDKPVIQASVTS